MARALALDPEGRGGYVLDGFGGLHAFGGAPRAVNGPTWPGSDRARDVSLIADGNRGRPQGYVLTASGAVHPVNGAPPVPISRRWASGKARYLDVAP